MQNSGAAGSAAMLGGSIDISESDTVTIIKAHDHGIPFVSLAPGLVVVDCLTAAELSAALGREHVVHAVVMPGRLARSLVSDAARLGGFRAGTLKSEGNGTGSR